MKSKVFGKKYKNTNKIKQSEYSVMPLQFLGRAPELLSFMITFFFFELR